MSGLITEAALARPNVVFVTGDLGFSVVEDMQAKLGERFINAGVSEANMATMAACLTFCGLETYVYSITPFVTARCYEQIRNDICYHNAPVRLIGNGAGFSYGTMGPTHHALEDATILATLPNMTVFSPANLSELDQLFYASAQITGPIYYRLGRENGPEVSVPAFDLQTPVVVWNSGKDVNLVTSGSIAGEVFAAAEALRGEGIDLRLVTVPVLAPFPKDALSAALAPAPTIVAFEGYSGNPLEAGVATLFAEEGVGRKVRFLSAGRSFAEQVGGTDFQRANVGLDRSAISAAVRDILHSSAGAERSFEGPALAARSR